ncbi:MAG TPA: ABC transporter ATP-binding protein [Candidatus Limnocylindrales bacterium]|nr:ABC transporter ATP-binding protein [Candidatus Limnocylindrales bacterium]
MTAASTSAQPAAAPLLDVTNLAVAYDGMRALQEVSLTADAGSIVALVGANGAGKTSLLRAISGLVRAERGTIRFGGVDITRMPAHRIVRLGIAHVPEGRRVFASATVRDNLLLGAYVDRDAAHRSARLEAAFAAFPILRERLEQRASTLSGGEQQMLAIARGTMSGPRLLMLDEPSLGIAPKLIPQIYAGVKAIAAGGTTVLLVEQNVREALRAADTGYVLQTGRVVLHGPARDLIGDPLVQEAFLGISAA